MSGDSKGSRNDHEPDGAASLTGHLDVGTSVTAPPEISASDLSEHRSASEHSPSLESNNSEPSSGDDERGDDERSRGGSRRLKRPPLAGRQSSGTIIVPRDRDTSLDAESVEYPPDDARAMSPRRNSSETQAMEEEKRAKMRVSARETQLTLLGIAESIELVRQSHSQLQRQNEMLQDYIGGLTRSMAQPPARAGKTGKK